MKKWSFAAAAAVLTVSMTCIASADDIVVRTSIGSGEVIFTETSEAVDISAEELTDLVKTGLESLKEKDSLDIFVDAAADVSLKIDEENELAINASAIGQLMKNGDAAYANVGYSFDGMGQNMGGHYQAYNWKSDGKTFSAISEDEGEWNVSEEDALSEVFGSMGQAMESKEAAALKLDAIQPNLYESEDGSKFYVCLYNKDTLLSAAGSVEAAQLYAGLADAVIGDNDLQFVVIIDAETGLLRAISLNASGAAGTVPGALLGADSDFEYSSNDLYATILLSEDADEIEIPEEVLNAPVQEGPVEEVLGEIGESFGAMEEDLEEG